MPSSVDHLKKAISNKDFALGIDHSDPTSAGWAIVALFYSALHFTDAFFVTIANTAADDAGFNARYRMRVYDKQAVDDATPSLVAIEKHIKSLL